MVSVFGFTEMSLERTRVVGGDGSGWAGTIGSVMRRVYVPSGLGINLDMVQHKMFYF